MATPPTEARHAAIPPLPAARSLNATERIRLAAEIVAAYIQARRELRRAPITAAVARLRSDEPPPRAALQQSPGTLEEARRLGYAVAPQRAIDAMDLLVLNTFTCAAEFTQVAAIEALRDSTDAVDAMVAEYRKRRDLFVTGLNRIAGFRCQAPEGAFYAWVNIEDTGLSAQDLASTLLEEAGVAAIAGAAFGAAGKNYLRFSLVSARHSLEEALDRIARVSVRWRAAVAR